MAFSKIVTGFTVLTSLLVLACGSSSGGGKKTGMPSQPPPAVVGPMPTSLDATCANATAGPFESAERLPVPSGIRVFEDDNNVRFSWNGDLNTPPAEIGVNVEGYRVCWGKASEGPNHGALFVRNTGQLFGVANGVEHVAVIQAVDSMGRVSSPSETITFKGDPSRVENLRRTMTGFFDDFNTDTGALDELRWNTAFTGIDPLAGFTYVGPQQYAIMLMANNTQMPDAIPAGGRGQNLVRPRPIFDFVGREGRIVFDMPGTFSPRVTWYVDVLPYESEADIIDITGHATFDPGPGHPGRFLRFSQNGSIVRIHMHDAAGEPLFAKEVDVRNVDPNVELGQNMPMRRFDLRVARDHAQVYIDDVLVLDNADIELDFERGVVQKSIFGYNPIKIQQRWARLEFDNFGFDGPPTTTVMHNYKMTANYLEPLTSEGGGDPTWDHQIYKWNLMIPDSLDGARSVRFFYSINQHQYFWDARDHIIINGQDFPFPEPISPTGNTWQSGKIAGDDQPYSTSIEMPAGLIKGNGEGNFFEFYATKAKLENIHIEAYFDPGTAPAFTQPTAYIQTPFVPSLEPLGPYGDLSTINDDGAPGVFNAGPEQTVLFDSPLSGVVRFGLKGHAYLQELGDGRNLGIARLELVIDGTPVLAVDTDAAVAAPEIDDGPGFNFQSHPSTVNVEFDTTLLTNGDHRVEVRAYDSSGRYGTTPWFADPGHHIIVAN